MQYTSPAGRGRGVRWPRSFGRAVGLAAVLAASGATRAQAPAAAPAPAPAAAEPNPLDVNVVDEGVRQLFAAELKANVARYAGQPDVLVRQGLVANRKARTVEIRAVGCGVRASDPTEFILIGEKGKAYEALTLTLAQPADVHAALVFIGVEPGYPSDPQRFRLWSKGERVDLTLTWTRDGQEIKVAAEDLIMDQTLGPEATLAKTGWVFAGSVIGDGSEKGKYLADLVGDIATTFTSQWTVLDNANIAVKGEVYGRRLPNPKYLLKMRQPVKVVLTPQLPPGQRRVLDYAILTGGAAGGAAADATALRFTVTGRDGQPVLKAGSFKELLDLLQAGVQARRDLYLKLAFHDQASLAALVEFGPLLKTIVQQQLVRLEPDPEQLFIEAFMPNPVWRDPDQRVQQPVEVHLPAAGDQLRLRYFDEELLADGAVKLHERTQDCAGVDGLRQAVAARADWGTANVLFFAPPGTPYGVVRRLYLALRDRFPIAYVFLDPKP